MNLTDDLSEQLEQSETGMIDNTQGPGVARYLTSDRRVRVDVYIGLKLDGLTLYDNISSVYPDIKMQFAVPPVISCQSDVLTFNPDNDSVINIQVIYMQLLQFIVYLCVSGLDRIVDRLGSPRVMVEFLLNFVDTFCKQ